MSFVQKLDKLFGDPSVKYIKSIQGKIDAINLAEKEFEALSDEELKKKTEEFKGRVANGETLDDILVEAFATVREAAKRVIGQRHYDVQLIGGITLHQGNIAEMKTGEGKTLTSTLAIYLNALSGKGVHVVTVNDYLARRDCSWMGQIYNFLGLSIGCVQNQLVTYVYDQEAVADADEADQDHDGELDQEELGKLEKLESTNTFKVDMDRLRRVEHRKEAYDCDITYGTNNEFGFDYLRDNMAQALSQKSQRGLSYCIIDEVDSILIDEARTPLIISAPDTEGTEQYHTYKRVVDQLAENRDYNIDEKMRAASFTEEGQDKIAQILNRDPWKEMDYQTTFHLEAALKAKAIFNREVDYVVKDGEVVIVDEFTGRMMPGRRYSEGLHQALEAKEGLEVQRESKTMATITFQNLFRMYDKLSGMTGTAETEKEEFQKIYGLDVVVIPTNRPIARVDMTDLIYKTKKAKYDAVIRAIKQRSEDGQPILIGTISIEDNELLSKMLDKANIAHNVLNAKNHEKEAEFIAQAGRPGAVTLATNMAGRGVDIILGGNPGTPEDKKKVFDAGGLHVIGTERHESRRIDNQLRGRSGRQGDPGSTQFFVSLEDDLMRIFGSDRLSGVMNTLKVPDDMPIENRMISRSLESAQKKVEGNNFDVRKRIVEYDDVVNKQRTAIYEMRNKILESEGLDDAAEIYREMIFDMIVDEIEAVVLFHTGQENENRWDLSEVYEVMKTMIPLKESDKKSIEDIRKEAGDDEQDHEARTHIINYLIGLAENAFDQLEETVENPDLLKQVEKQMMLRAIDHHWVMHLESMQHLRAGIGLRGYGQKDPLIEYKREAFGLFNRLQEAIRKTVVYSIFKIESVVEMKPGEARPRNVVLSGAEKTMERGESAFAKASARQGKKPLVGESNEAKARAAAGAAVGSIADESRGTFGGQKVGRNDPCPCGSGLKFKKCHGK